MTIAPKSTPFESPERQMIGKVAAQSFASALATQLDASFSYHGGPVIMSRYHPILRLVFDQ